MLVALVNDDCAAVLAVDAAVYAVLAEALAVETLAAMLICASEADV